MFKLRRLSDRTIFYVLFITFYSTIWTVCTIHIKTTVKDTICMFILIVVQIICIKIQIRSYKLRSLFDTMMEYSYLQSCRFLGSYLAEEHVKSLKESIRQDKIFRKIMRSTIW